MVIIDTTVWIDYLGGVENAQTEWLDEAQQRMRLGLTDLILCELLQGVRGDAMFAQVRREMMRFEIFSTGGMEMAVASAQNFRTLRAKGITVRKTIDCLIATFCITGEHLLLHHDRDFDAFEQHLGLRVVAVGEA
jgi:predicted nucleic acid-binding protein